MSNPLRLEDFCPQPPGDPRLTLDESRVRIRAATSEGRRSEVAALIERRYTWRGYQTPQLRPDAMVLAAEDPATGRAIGTIGARIDGPDGLGCQEAFGDIVDGLRSDGLRLAEFVGLATETGASKLALGALFHAAYLFATRVGHADFVLMEVNPRHRGFYARSLGFEALCEERLCGRANAPAILMGQRRAKADAIAARLGGTWRQDAPSTSLFSSFFSPEEAHGLCLRLFGDLLAPEPAPIDPTPPAI